MAERNLYIFDDYYSEFYTEIINNLEEEYKEEINNIISFNKTPTATAAADYGYKTTIFFDLFVKSDFYKFIEEKAKNNLFCEKEEYPPRLECLSVDLNSSPLEYYLHYKIYTFDMNDNGNTLLTQLILLEENNYNREYNLNEILKIINSYIKHELKILSKVHLYEKTLTEPDKFEIIFLKRFDPSTQYVSYESYIIEKVDQDVVDNILKARGIRK